MEHDRVRQDQAHHRDDGAGQTVSEHDAAQILGFVIEEK